MKPLILQLIIVSCITTGLIHAYHVQTGFQSDMIPLNKLLQFLSEQKKHNDYQLRKQLDQNRNDLNQQSSSLDSGSSVWNQFMNQFNQLTHSFNYPNYNSPFAFTNQQNRPMVDPFYGQFHGFLFTCDGLKPGFYSDVYNSCRYFHLCHQPNLKFNPLNQLAVTTYACPHSMFFNQKKLACTRLEEFEGSCADQIYLFKSNSSIDASTDLNKFENSDKSSIINEVVYNKLMKNKDEQVSNEIVSNNSQIDAKVNSDQNFNLKSIDNNTETNANNLNVDDSSTNTSNIDKKDESNDLIEITFSCEGRPYGYYVDIYNDCRVFHICQPVDLNGKKTIYMNSFRCPFDLKFNQATLTCTNEKNLIVPCHSQEILFNNAESNNQLISDSVDESKSRANDEINTDLPATVLK